MSPKRSIIVGLLVLTLIAGVAAIVIGYRLQHTVTPTPAEAGASCGYCANPGTGSGDCRDPNTGQPRADSCDQAAKNICGGLCCCSGWNAGSNPTPTTGGGGGTCTVDNPNVTVQCIKVSSGCGTVGGKRFKGPAPAGVHTDGGCVGYSQNGTDISVGPGQLCVNPGCGECEQVDFVMNGTSYGTAKYGGDCPQPTNTPANTPTNTPVSTPTATPTPSPSSSPTITPTPLPNSCGQTCDPNQGTNACTENTTHTCTNVNGTYKCLLNQCISNPNSCYSDGCTPVPQCGQVCDPNQTNACPTDHTCQNQNGTFRCVLNQCIADPNTCQTDGCTPVNPLNVQKSGTPSCNTTGDITTVVYTIRIANPSANSRTITVVDTLDPSILDSYVQTSSISNGGVFANKTITWTGLTIGANATITLTYTLTIPKAGFGVKNNTVVVTEDGLQRGRATASVNASCLPSTALISDSADRLLLGFMLLILGIVIYRLGLYTVFNRFIYKIGGEKIMSLVDPNVAENIHTRQHHKKVQEFAEKVKNTEN